MLDPSPISHALAGITSAVRAAARVSSTPTADLAAATGIHPVSLRRFRTAGERGDLSPATLDRLAVALGLQVSVTYRITTPRPAAKNSRKSA